MMRILGGPFAPRAVKALGFSDMARPFFLSVAILSFLGLGMAPRDARGEPPSARPGPLYVLSLWTDDADDQADALTQALRWRVGQAQGFTLLQTTQSFETLAIALRCPPKPDIACLQRIGDQLKADHYLWGIMDKKKAAPGEVNVEVHLWARGKPDTSTRENYSDTLKDANDESLRTIATGIFARLTGFTPPPPSPPPAPASSATAAPPPNLAGGGLQTLGVAVAPGPAAPAAEEAEQFPTRAVLAYSAFAVGAALIVLSGIEAANWVSDNNKSSDDRKQVPSTISDVCAQPVNLYAQDACNRSKDALTSSTMAWVFGGLGVGLVGTGIVLMLTDHPSNSPPEDHSGNQARLVPVIGPSVGRLDLRVSF
jgi:hypothetical protein